METSIIYWYYEKLQYIKYFIYKSQRYNMLGKYKLSKLSKSFNAIDMTSTKNNSP